MYVSVLFGIFCMKHVRKVVDGFGKKFRTGVRKPGNTCASLTAMI